MSFKGKVIAITGGASGIGLATAKIIASRGGTVCIADISPAALDAAEEHFRCLESEAGEKVPFSVSKVDVSRRSEVEDWIKGIVAQFGRLDGAANVAGVIGKNHSVGALADMEDDEWERIIGVNLTGCMYCLRAELRSISDKGSIVNVASIHGTNGEFSFESKYMSPGLLIGSIAMAYHAAYGASKHGVVGLTRAAAKENGEREIRVNAVAPGAIYTPMMQQAWQQTGRESDAPFSEPSAFQRQGTPEEVAGVICFLLGPESTFVSGSVYAVDGAWL